MLERIAAMAMVNQPPDGTLYNADETNRPSIDTKNKNTGMTMATWTFQIMVDTRATSQVVIKPTPTTHVP